MQTFQIRIAQQFYTSLDELIDYREAFNPEFAEKFAFGVLEEITKLQELPFRGMNLGHQSKAIIYESCLVLYDINESDQSIDVFDIVDPRQHTKASKYIF